MKSRWAVVLCWWMLLALAACGDNGSGGTSPEDIRMYASQTAAARSGIPTLAVTRQLPTVTVLATGATPSGSLSDKFSFVGDVSIPDGTLVPAGATFIKTWRVKNSGESVWDASYTLVFKNGTVMGGQPVNALSITAVNPGEEVEISLNLSAPSAPGTYKGYWTLRSGRSGKNFEQDLYVEIEVVKLSGDAQNFAGQMCAASWTGDGNPIPCFGSPSDPHGFVSYTDAPAMENGGQDDEPSLVVTLPGQAGSQIVGRYPAMVVQPGSHFRGLFGCYDQATACNVRLLVTYQVNNGSELILGEWVETYDGNFTRIDIDLDAADLDNQQVKFNLYFSANGASEENKIYCIGPRLQIP